MSSSGGGRRLRFHLKMTGNDGFIPHPELSGRTTNNIDLNSSRFSVPLLAQDEMRRTLQNLEWAEELGFDSVAMIEQRSPAIYPSSTVIASWLLAKSKRIHVGATGPVSSTYLNPLKIAEEIAMLDVMSGGRCYFAFPVGIGAAFYQMQGNPTIARRRHAEAVALVMRALTEPGPFEHRGEFFDLPIVDIFPQPLRRPPETWIPAAGSRESHVEAARGHHTYMTFTMPRQGVKHNIEAFRQVANEEFGYDPPPEQVSLVLYCYVAESDAQARKEAEAAVLWFHQNVLIGSFEDFVPPGSTSVSSIRARMRGGHFEPSPAVTLQQLIDDRVALVGSPETVRSQLEEYADEVRAGQVTIYGDNGLMPEWMVRKSLDMFAREVMPHFRPPGGRPFWAEEEPAGFEFISEAGARLPEPPLPPLVKIDGQFYDARTAHVDDLRVPVSEEILELHRNGGRYS